MLGRQMWVSCDGECGAEVLLEGSEATAKKVRAAARAEDWSSWGGEDYCPDCRPDEAGAAR